MNSLTESENTKIAKRVNQRVTIKNDPPFCVINKHVIFTLSLEEKNIDVEVFSLSELKVPVNFSDHFFPPSIGLSVFILFF
mgnify:CR=1 FL=1